MRGNGTRRAPIVIRTAGRGALPAFSVRVDVRTLALCVLLVAVTGVFFLVALSVGDYVLSPVDVLAALGGGGTPQARLVVGEWRLPRALLAIVIGAALGMSGAVFQSLTRNPLGSPDIIGFTTGAYTGGLVVILIFGGGYLLTAIGAVAGGVVTALLVYALTYRGGIQGFRLIIIGIGVSATLASVNSWLSTRADLDDAMQAAAWGSGSLNGVGYDQLWPVLGLLAVVCPVLLAQAPALRQLELGDDLAQALGVRVEAVRLRALLCGILLVAIATAAVGPVAFVALVAPQIAARLRGSSTIALIPAGLTGGIILLCSDIAAQRAFAPTQLPVGVMTVVVGGAYFVWLLIRQSRPTG
ncbi:iron chelate uptake ABC transporter family permease subunit [Microbacterium sp. cx-59]|uniref:FecCD family ABC transporter permease n=1 Tax=Microbacterium sp. cx-59 TaxID=2891207 RepID=UPI001E60596E|nr:iron chelate uptake ABC transporter family permease subunit [Microbacterium sp. cx-59]MCC4907411.1 iron chelate uptake ABC transporter family permease subunit [Microbacterium sp. cx-59]